jgi:adenylate cyclase
MPLFAPSTWPLAAKLWLALLVASVAPMSIVAIYNLHQSLATVEETTYQNLELLARGTADRIDQLLGDTHQSVAQVAGDDEVAAYLSGAPETRERLGGTVRQTLNNVVRSNSDIASVMLLDRTGVCITSTNLENLGQSYAFRDYFQGAVAGGSFTSELLTGSTSRHAGIYFTHEVKDAKGELAGVAVLKLTHEALDAITDSMHAEGTREALVVDSFGVVISSSDKTALYGSLVPLSPEVEALPAFRQRFTSIGLEHIKSLDLEGLNRAVSAASKEARASYVTGTSRRIAGISKMNSRKWAVIVEEPASTFEEPMALLARKERLSLALVGLFVTVLALLLARNIVRPVNRLTAAAKAVAQGHFDAAKVEVTTKDELGALAEAFNTMAKGLHERERERDMFGRAVSPEVREKLLGGELRLGGETLWVSVLFSDIRGFSTISEKMEPLAVVDLLNEYMTEMAEAVRPYHGYINNFIGDAIVVVFGAPISRPKVERLAVEAALAMRGRLARLNVKRAARGETAIETGIGIGAGEVVAGNIGSLERMLYTVIGDVVNVASRLETMTKDYPGHSILITGRVAAEVGGDGGEASSGKSEGGNSVCSLNRIGPVKVKGRVDPVDVYAVGPPKPTVADPT